MLYAQSSTALMKLVQPTIQSLRVRKHEKAAR